MLQPGDKVRLIANPGKIGIVGNETDGKPPRLRWLVTFLDGDEEFILSGSLEKVEKAPRGPNDLMRAGRYGRASDLRGAITHYRLSGKLANLIYSLNTTNTRFLAYQFKPVLQFLDSPSGGLLIADEVGLGKTIEAGLIWTELRAREDARRLLVICPAMLCEKWKRELDRRFGVHAEITDAAGLLEHLKEAKTRPDSDYALVVSQQGTRPPKGWDSENSRSRRASARLARFLDDEGIEGPLIDLTIIDEAHYLRNQETQSHRFGRLLRPTTQHLVMLTATPVQLRNTDLFNLVHLLDEDAFPYSASFDNALSANAPIIRLRDAILKSGVRQAEFKQAISEAAESYIFRNNSQIGHLQENPPTTEELSDPDFRSELADRLDKIGLLSKVVTRTLKRDVQEERVERQATVIRAPMSQVEEEFYLKVTESVRAYCEGVSISEGFMLTIPQRQMASCMAAACRGWQEKLAEKSPEELEDLLYELDADRDLDQDSGIGPLLLQLVQISRSVGDYQALRNHDTKFELLFKSLLDYWQRHPRKKVVLFSFYRNTLHYLADRLREERIESVIVHGGLDKDAAIALFESEKGPDILLSTEVAAEGIDLQFSSLLINYDLPWNPAKIEQRIGRIDRIGQEEPQILIWNLVYENTIDERVHDRLLERLDIFRNALGSMEVVLGEQIRSMAYELMSHDLSPEREIERIKSTQVAIATKTRQERILEEEASALIAHGDFINNKVKAAEQLGRYISGEDLYIYVKDYFRRYYPGTQMVSLDSQSLLTRMELSTEALVDLESFQNAHRLPFRTMITSARAPKLLFKNKFGHATPGIERVTQDHPLIRFVSEGLRSSKDGPAYFPVSAVELSKNEDSEIAAGVYVYVVYRWTLSGSRDIERLEYQVRQLNKDFFLPADQAELLVNSAALRGRDWLDSPSVVNGDEAADYQSRCVDEIDKAFEDFRAHHERQNADRIDQMIRAIEHRIDSNQRKMEAQVAGHQASENPRRRSLVPAVRKRFGNEEMRLRQRIKELRLKNSVQSHQSAVSSGIIRVI